MITDAVDEPIDQQEKWDRQDGEEKQDVAWAIGPVAAPVGNLSQDEDVNDGAGEDGHRVGAEAPPKCWVHRQRQGQRSEIEEDAVLGVEEETPESVVKGAGGAVHLGFPLVVAG